MLDELLKRAIEEQTRETTISLLRNFEKAVEEFSEKSKDVKEYRTLLLQFIINCKAQNNYYRHY